ncbi:MAG: 3-dehydroquinate synthase [Thermomicrobiales bacterium]
METIHQRVQVTYEYPVHFTDNVFSLNNDIVRDLCSASAARTSVKVLCVVDGGLSSVLPELTDDIEAYFRDARTTASLVQEPMLVAGGEAIKNDHQSVDEVLRAIEWHGIDRHSYVIAVGGGALLDMVGYAAAIAHRGVRLIRIPTTVLSQDDSGVGVKNSVNAFGKKNFLGTFAPPYAVINDMALLTRLPDRDWLSGVSEAVKVALLKDSAFFNYLEANASGLIERDVETMRQVVYRSAQLHLNHIATSGDPFEFGSSRPLDFGHWSAHKLEQISNYRWRHGEAVSIGISLDSTYAYLNGMLGESDWKRIITLFESLDLPVYADELATARSPETGRLVVLDGLNEFREHLGGELTIMLLHGIGQGVEVHEMDEARIIESIEMLRQRSNARSFETEEVTHAG